ncbi:MAG: hypothetical protein NVS1B14_11260 [Vulcanimicrobiaceae bacterium]
MKVETLVPDVPSLQKVPLQPDKSAFAAALDAVGSALGRARDAETAFAAHRGSLQDMVLERARADVTLSVATASVQRAAQALQTILNMQI